MLELCKMKKRFVAPVLRAEANLAQLTLGFNGIGSQVIICLTCDFNIDNIP